MSIKDTKKEVLKFANLAEEIRKRATKVSDLRNQNKAFETGNSLLETAKSRLLEEIKEIKDERKGLRISKSRLEKSLKTDKKKLKVVSASMNKVDTKYKKILKDTEELRKEFLKLTKDNEALAIKNSSVDEDSTTKLENIQQAMQVLSDLQEQLDIKEILLKKRESKLDLREEALS